MRRHSVCLIVLLSGCGGDAGLPGGDADGTPDLGIPGTAYRYVLRSLTLPMMRSDFAIDLNGDGRPDNQFGNLMSVFNANNLNPQALMDGAIAMGAGIELFQLLSADPKLQNAVPAELTAYAAGRPDKFSGAYPIDLVVPPAAFTGMLHMASFESANPVTTTLPVDLQLRLALIEGAGLLPLSLHGAHLQFQTGTDGTTGAPALLQGQIHGSVKEGEIQTAIIPALAQFFTKKLQANPHPGLGSNPAGSIFDTGGCTNPDGTQAKASDGIIDFCEVAQNSIIKALVSPDVQIYDANGHYAPNKNNVSKDSFSIGVGFTAIRSRF